MGKARAMALRHIGISARQYHEGIIKKKAHFHSKSQGKKKNTEMKYHEEDKQGRYGENDFPIAVTYETLIFH